MPSISKSGSTPRSRAAFARIRASAAASGRVAGKVDARHAHAALERRRHVHVGDEPALAQHGLRGAPVGVAGLSRERDLLGRHDARLDEGVERARRDGVPRCS